MQLEHVATFIAVVKNKNFTGAANALRLSKPVISKHVSALEEALQCQLFKRTTRKLSLTEVGHAFYKQIKNIPDQLHHAEQMVQHFNEQPQGILKIFSPTNIARSLKEDIIPNFLQTYPDVTLQLHFKRPIENYLNEVFDIIILWKLNHINFPDYNLIAKKLFVMPVGLYATPNYLSKYGEPKNPEDLKNHNCFSSIGERWPFRDKNGMLFYQQVSGKINTHDDEVLKNVVMRDLGICYSYPFLFEEELINKKVVPLLKNNTQLFIEVYACFHPTNYLPLKISAFIEMVKTYYQQKQKEILERGKK